MSAVNAKRRVASYACRSRLGQASKLQHLLATGGHQLVKAGTAGDCESCPANREFQLAMAAGLAWRRASSMTC
jgi:hypothetical protein